MVWYLCCHRNSDRLAVAYFCKNNSDDPDQSGTDFTEDEDFDLDADLKPAEREYVSLNKDPEKTSETDAAKSRHNRRIRKTRRRMILQT